MKKAEAGESVNPFIQDPFIQEDKILTRLHSMGYDGDTY